MDTLAIGAGVEVVNTPAWLGLTVKRDLAAAGGITAAQEVGIRSFALPSRALPPLLEGLLDPPIERGEKALFVRLDPDIWMAYLLRYWRERSGMTQKQLAAKLGISYQAYQRMERPGKSNVTVQTLERIADALGGELILDMRLKRKAG